MVEHGGTTVIKKRRKADVLRGAVIALIIAGLGAALSLAKAQDTSQIITNIRNQVARCWVIPPGPMDAEILVTRIKIFLNTDGSLSKSPEILGDHYKTGDPLYDAIAESARRALWRCQPLKNLPVNKYAVWKVIILTFDADTYMANRGM